MMRKETSSQSMVPVMARDFGCSPLEVWISNSTRAWRFQALGANPPEIFVNRCPPGKQRCPEGTRSCPSRPGLSISKQELFPPRPLATVL